MKLSSSSIIFLSAVVLTTLLNLFMMSSSFSSTSSSSMFVNAQNTTTAAPKPEPTMGWQAWVCVGSVIAVLVFLFAEIASCCAVMFMITLFLLLCGILNTADFLGGLSNSGVITVALLYIVVGPLTELPIVRKVIQYTIAVDPPKKKKKVITETKDGEKHEEEVDDSSCMDFIFQSQIWARFKICTVCMCVSPFVNNTPLVAMITPIVKNFCRERGTSPAQILMSMNTATLLGGSFAVIGTSTNLIWDGFMRGTYLGPMPFFELIKVSGIPAIFALFYMCVMPPLLLPTEAGGLFRMLRANASSFLGQFLILPHSPLVASGGVTVADFENLLPAHLQSDMKLTQIVRHLASTPGRATTEKNRDALSAVAFPSAPAASHAPLDQQQQQEEEEENTIVVTLAPPPPTERFLPGDVLVFAGELHQLNSAARALGLQWLPTTNLTAAIPHVASTAELEKMIVGEMLKKTANYVQKQKQQQQEQPQLENGGDNEEKTPMLPSNSQQHGSNHSFTENQEKIMRAMNSNEDLDQAESLQQASSEDNTNHHSSNALINSSFAGKKTSSVVASPASLANNNVVSFQNSSFAVRRTVVSVNDNENVLRSHRHIQRNNSVSFADHEGGGGEGANNNSFSGDNTKAVTSPLAPTAAESFAASGSAVDFVEIVLSHQSPVVGMSVGSGAFQRLYGVCVLALRPHGVKLNVVREAKEENTSGDEKKTDEEMKEKKEKSNVTDSSSDSDDDESDSNKSPDLTGHRLAAHLYGVGDTILVVGSTSFIDRFPTHFFVASKCEDTSQRKEEVQHRARLRVAVPAWFPCGIYPEDEAAAENQILPTAVVTTSDSNENKKKSLTGTPKADAKNEPAANEEKENKESAAAKSPTTPSLKKHHHHHHKQKRQKYIIIPEWYGYLTLPIFLAMMACAIGGFDIVICACVAVCAVVMFRIVTLKEAIGSIDLETVIMVAFSLGLGHAMKNSGLADVVGNLVHKANITGFPLLLLLAVVTAVFTNVISSKATASMMFPIVFSIYTQSGVNPLGALMTCTVLSSVALCTPYAFATNVIIMGPGGYSPSDFVKFGLALNLVMVVLVPVIAATVYDLCFQDAKGSSISEACSECERHETKISLRSNDNKRKQK